MPLNSDDVDTYVDLKWTSVSADVEAMDFPHYEKEGVEKLSRLCLGKGFVDGYRQACEEFQRRLSTPKKR